MVLVIKDNNLKLKINNKKEKVFVFYGKYFDVYKK